MALVDPYSPCPCGSGQKFKWCCHKVEPVAERAQRLFEGGQSELAIQAIDEGLRKEPGNAWLLTRKALYLTRMGRPEPAKAAVRLVLEQNPKHAGAQMLMTRLVLETEGASAGAAQLQHALTSLPRESRRTLAGLAKVVGAFLSEAVEVPAAMKHLRLALALDPSGEADPAVTSTLRTLEGNPSVSPWLSRLGATPEAVDLEALCQQVAPEPGDDQVEHVQLSWPIRDRKALLDALNADPTFHAEEPAPLDPEDEDGPEVDQFSVLDRPEIGRTSSGLKVADIPRIEGRLFVGPETVALETFDDGRLDRLAGRFTATAGRGIPPAHPKTKVVGKVPGIHLALMWEWLLPEGVDPEQSRRLTREQGVHLIDTVWPETPNPSFGGRSPLRAAKAGDAEVPLRAAVFQFELSRESWREGFDFAALRSRLNIPPEPPIDPETVDVAALHLARLALVPADRLNDEKLAALYRRARQSSLEDAMEAAARALAGRPEAMERHGVESLSVYTDLASIASSRGRAEESFEWVRRGRQADPPAKRARNAPAWDIFEVRLRARTEDPSGWVPDLAVLLDRYREDVQATQTLMMNLIDMGLLEMVNNPERPGEILLDSRPLQALMAEFGPRVTTASGRLGVSAA
ncbi:MAG: hypothetical protein LC745_04320, partial [Planctomycetia bacterium]|nr:hypothetical protein [Planctomycetia bacterium]